MRVLNIGDWCTSTSRLASLQVNALLGSGSQERCWGVFFSTLFVNVKVVLFPLCDDDDDGAEMVVVVPVLLF